MSIYEVLRPKKTSLMHDRHAVPIKMSFFMENLLRGRIPVDEIVRRFAVVGPSICGCCFSHEETVDHLFSTGPWASGIWFSLEAIFCVHASRSIGIFQCCVVWWSTVSNNVVHRFVLRILPIILCCFMW